MKELLCRACLSRLDRPFLSLGDQPLSNAYLKPEQLKDKEPAYPLDVYLCANCRLVQLPEFERASNIFNEEYAYFSSYSTSWLEHCRQYVDMASGRFKLGPESFVVEVASNDGYLLQYFRSRRIPVLGIEPAAATARVAREKGVPTDVCFFDVPYAKKLSESGRKADLVIGNNVIAHNPNLRDFTEALSIALKPEGVITLEFPHVLRMLQGNQFDTIYHEHYSYFSLYSLIRMFGEFGLSVFDVDEIETHGGSLRVYACLTGSARDRKSAPNVDKVMQDEEKNGLHDKKTYAGFGARVEKAGQDALEFLEKAKARGKKVIAYGAPAKGNTLLNYCGIRTDLLPFTVDKSPHKQGRFLPGSRIPVYAPEKVFEAKPDYLLILPWNLKEEIAEQMKGIRQWNGKFVTAIPSLEVF